MIIAVAGWRGTGVTTTALLLATCLAAGDQGAWLIEADPAGGMLAGRIELAAHTVGGLERLAFPTERSTAVDAFEAAAHQLGNLRIVSAPADPFRAHACHQPRMPWMSSLRDLPGVVIVDVGRLRGGSPAWGVLSRADLALLVCSPEVSTAVATSEWLRAGGRVSPIDPGLPPQAVRLVVVDAPGGVSFPRAVLQADLADHWVGWLPWDPVAVDFVHRGAPPSDRRLRRSALIGAAGDLAVTLRRAVHEGIAR